MARRKTGQSTAAPAAATLGSTRTRRNQQDPGGEVLAARDDIDSLTRSAGSRNANRARRVRTASTLSQEQAGTRGARGSKKNARGSTSTASAPVTGSGPPTSGNRRPGSSSGSTTSRNQGSSPQQEAPSAGQSATTGGSTASATEQGATAGASNAQQQSDGSTSPATDNNAPVTTTTTGANGGSATVSGTPGSPAKHGREAEDGDGKPESPKKQRFSGDEQQDNGTAGSPNETSCEQLERLLQACRDRARTNSTEFEDPIQPGRDLSGDNVYRAIAAVSAASKDTKGQPRFCILDNVTLQFIQAGAGTEATMVMPSHALLPVIIPYTDGNHTSLFYSTPFSSDANARHVFICQDSSNSHRHLPRASTIANQLYANLQAAGWRVTVDTTNTAIESTTTSLQQQPWTCGIHTIFNAWTHVLDLRPTSTPIARYLTFIQTGSEIIRLALQGRVDAQTIWAFFDCFKFIEAGQSVAAEHNFETTVPLLTETTSLNELIGRQRLQEQINEYQRRIGLPQGFEEDAATAMALYGPPRYQGATVEQLIQSFLLARASEESRQQANQEYRNEQSTGQQDETTDGTAGSLANNQLPGLSASTSSQIVNTTQPSQTPTAASGTDHTQHTGPTAAQQASPEQPNRSGNDDSPSQRPSQTVGAALPALTGGLVDPLGGQDSAQDSGAPTNPPQQPGESNENAQSGTQAPSISALEHLLNSMPASIVPGTPEHAAHRSRQQEEERARLAAQAQTHIKAAQQAANHSQPPTVPRGSSTQALPGLSLGAGQGTFPAAPPAPATLSTPPVTNNDEPEEGEIIDIGDDLDAELFGPEHSDDEDGHERDPTYDAPPIEDEFDDEHAEADADVQPGGPTLEEILAKHGAGSDARSTASRSSLGEQLMDELNEELSKGGRRHRNEDSLYPANLGLNNELERIPSDDLETAALVRGEIEVSGAMGNDTFEYSDYGDCTFDDGKEDY